MEGDQRMKLESHTWLIYAPERYQDIDYEVELQLAVRLLGQIHGVDDELFASLRKLQRQARSLLKKEGNPPFDNRTVQA